MRNADKRLESTARFRALRRHADLTQFRLAGIIGICRQAVSDIENKRTLPHYETWGRFAVLEAKHMQPQPTMPVHWE